MGSLFFSGERLPGQVGGDECLPPLRDGPLGHVLQPGTGTGTEQDEVGLSNYNK